MNTTYEPTSSKLTPSNESKGFDISESEMKEFAKAEWLEWQTRKFHQLIYEAVCFIATAIAVLAVGYLVWILRAY